MSQVISQPRPSIEAALAAELRQRGQRVTPQRLAIARELEKTGQHATAEQVHRRLQASVPGVSVPTVYATLDLLEEVGLVRRVLTESGAVVYDPRTESHHHLVCGACGTVIDIEAAVDDSTLLNAARKQGFAPENAQVVVSGLCSRCQSQS